MYFTYILYDIITSFIINFSHFNVSIYRIFTPFPMQNPSLFKIFFHYPISIYANKFFSLTVVSLNRFSNVRFSQKFHQKKFYFFTLNCLWLASGANASSTGGILKVDFPQIQFKELTKIFCLSRLKRIQRKFKSKVFQHSIS